MIDLMIYDKTDGIELFKGTVREDRNGMPVIPEELEIFEDHAYKVCICHNVTGAEFAG